MRSKLVSWRRPAATLVLAGLLLAPFVGAGQALAAPAGQTALPTASVPDPHLQGVTWFPATGHTLRGDFLDYWNRFGGLAQFGYPITEEFSETNPTSHQPLSVQYFQRARFEHHPENQDSKYRVLLGVLGRDFHAQDPRVAALANPDSEYFSMTGHNLSGAFRAYWHAHGGLFVNGYPLTEPFSEVNPIDGKKYTVQYFERARFELHPENAPPANVLLGLLGTQLAHNLGYFGPPTPNTPGPYPQFGHAADFSWIAGQVAVTRIQGGCTFLQYGDSRSASPVNMQVQPVGYAWNTAMVAGVARAGAFVVVFGHLATQNEPVPMCPARAYIVDRVIPNGAASGGG